MPQNSIICDLWNWDAHFEKELEDEWYFGAIFGDEDSIEAYAADLADYFHEQVEYFGIYYDQDGNEDWFQQYISEEAIKFIRNWREELFKKFAQGGGT
jgi:hypothetical protein